MRKINVTSIDDLDIVLNVSRSMFEKDGELTVRITKLEESLSDEQRSFYFVLCGVIGGELGYRKDEMHRLLKERYLLNIYIADIKNHPEFIGVVDNMAIIKQRCPELYDQNRALVLSGVSVTSATQENMRDFIKEVEGLAASQNIRIPAPPRILSGVK